MKQTLRKLASSAVWALCRLLPVKENKVVFCSFGGKGFGDNPKAIALALLETAPELDLVWLTRDPDICLPKGIRPCRFGTPQAVYELSTAKVWVDNSRSGAKYKKKNQKYLQTWHGYALKTIEAGAKNLPAHYVEQGKKDSKMIDLLLSNSRFMTDIFRRDFWYDGEIGEYGSPRNDVFFQPVTCQETVRAAYSLPAEQKLLLYAPTFRDNEDVSCYALDAERALSACRERFGGQWSALLRLHPNMAQKSKELFVCDGKELIDASLYADMQELMLTADLLVTDYSSSMFDFALSGKPCVRFATDLEQYKRDRDFYYSLEQLPFPLAQSNDELCDILRQLNVEDCRTRWAAFTEKNGFCEDGQASVRCAQWIREQIR